MFSTAELSRLDLKAEEKLLRDLVHHLLASRQRVPWNLPCQSRTLVSCVVNLTRGHVVGRVNSTDSLIVNFHGFTRVSLKNAATDDEAVLNGVTQFKVLLFADWLLCLGFFKRFFDQLVPKFALLGHLGGAGVRDGCPKSTKNRAYI